MMFDRLSSFHKNDQWIIVKSKILDLNVVLINQEYILLFLTKAIYCGGSLLDLNPVLDKMRN